MLADPKRVVPDFDVAQGYELAGFAWFQGWNDLVDGDTYPQRDKPGGYDAYSTAMAHFIRDVCKDLNAPKLPFVVGVLAWAGRRRTTAWASPKRWRNSNNSKRQSDELDAKAILP